MTRSRSGHALLGACLAIALIGPASCQDFDEIFTTGRLETLCDGSIQVCSVQAGCELDHDNYLRGAFPGGLRFVVRTAEADARLVLRILLETWLYPGTEIFVQAFDPACAEFEQLRMTDIDFFELAGGDRVLDLELDLPGRGDHLVEVFSDMATDYVMAVVVED